MGEDYLLAREIDQAAELGDLDTYQGLIRCEGELPRLATHQERWQLLAAPRRQGPSFDPGARRSGW